MADVSEVRKVVVDDFWLELRAREYRSRAGHESDMGPLVVHYIKCASAYEELLAYRRAARSATVIPPQVVDAPELSGSAGAS
jgi:hypothetical protein